MELGEKLRLARQEAGLSQRQLCGDVITRNMLSLIEHGTARPSMDTLRYLASRLGKPMSYFLEEDAVLSPNQAMMTRARVMVQAGQMQEAWVLLRDFQQPDPVLEWQWKYLSVVTALAMAEQAAREGKHRYARQLLEEASDYENGIPGLKRQRLLQLAKLPEADAGEIVSRLPSVDEELLLRAEAALAEKNAQRAAALLDAVENQDDQKWYYLRGRAHLLGKQHAEAVECLTRAENANPEQCWPLLEECFRELGDFKKAYEYACKQR